MWTLEICNVWCSSFQPVLNKQEMILPVCHVEQSRNEYKLPKPSNFLYFFNALEFIKIQIFIFLAPYAKWYPLLLTFSFTNSASQETPLYLLIDTASFLSKATTNYYILPVTSDTYTKCSDTLCTDTYICSILIVRWSDDAGL